MHEGSAAFASSGATGCELVQLVQAAVALFVAGCGPELHHVHTCCPLPSTCLACPPQDDLLLFRGWALDVAALWAAFLRQGGCPAKDPAALHRFDSRCAYCALCRNAYAVACWMHIVCALRQCQCSLPGTVACGLYSLALLWCRPMHPHRLQLHYNGPRQPPGRRAVWGGSHRQAAENGEPGCACSALCGVDFMSISKPHMPLSAGPPCRQPDTLPWPADVWC